MPFQISHMEPGQVTIKWSLLHTLDLCAEFRYTRAFRSYQINLPNVITSA